MAGEDTRRKLIEATLQVIREQGFADLSARSVAGTAGVNQALIFYHYGSMDGLVAETCRRATSERVEVWAQELAEVADLPALVDVARRLHEREAAAGNVTVLAQALAAAQTNQALSAVVGDALGLWLEPLETAARRILDGTVLDGLLSPADVARTTAAAFVGVELFEGVVDRGESDAFEVLERLAGLAALALESGPITKVALRRRLRSTEGTGRTTRAGKGTGRGGR